MGSATDKWKDQGIVELDKSQDQQVIDDSKVSKEDQANYSAELKRIYSDQCFLMTFAKRLANQMPLHPADFQNYAIVDGDAGLMVNHMLQDESIKEFLTIRPDQLSALIPKIEIYKVFYSADDDKGQDYLFGFPNYTDVSNLTKDKYARGDGAGIKDVQITMEGKNPAKKHILHVDLSLYFQDIKYLFKTQDVGDGKNMSFAHLITFPEQPGKDTSPFDPGIFRIKMLVGWRTPTNTKLFSPALQKAIKNTHMVLMLDLVDYQIDFANDGSVKLKIQYMGAIENSYRSPAGDIMRLEEESDEEKARQAKIEEYRENIKKLEKDKKDWVEAKVQEKIKNAPKDKKGITQLEVSQAELYKQAEASHASAIVAEKQAIQNKQQSSVAFSTQQFFRSMGESTLYYFDVTEEEVSTIDAAIATMGRTRNKGKDLKDIDGDLDTKVREIYSTIDTEGRVSAVDQINAQAESEQAIKDNQETIENQKNGLKINTDEAMKKTHLKRLQGKKWNYGSEKRLQGKNFRRIAFIKLGDVIDNLLGKVTKGIAKEMKMKNLTFMLGPLRFRDLISNQTKYLNIAELPIDIRVFNKFLTEKVIGEGRTSYFFQEFLEDLINELVYAALDSCRASGTSTDAADLELLPFSAPGGGSGDAGRVMPGTRLDLNKLIRLKQDFPKASHTPVKNLQNYLLLYAARQSSDQENGNYAQDIRNKIFHFVIGGPDSGLLKEVQFNKMNNKTWARAVYQQTKGDDNITAGTIKPSIWSISITTIGNTLISIGSKIYVDSTFVDGGTSVFHKLSFGGYYVVHKVIHTYTEAKYETQIVAKMEKTDWVIKSEQKIDAPVVTVPIQSGMKVPGNMG